GVRRLGRSPADHRVRGSSCAQRPFGPVGAAITLRPPGHNLSAGFPAAPLVAAAAAGPGRARVLARIERVSAGAGLDRVRVVNREPGAHETVDVVDLGAPEIGRAEVVDQDTNAALMHYFVTRPDVVVEGHPVLKARAAAAADEDPQGQLRVGLLVQERLE